ncbi:prophage tail fiber N-terminal domain-containing protein [Aeromonas veronii]|uniref:prophage tail fiber N-terminal domain-containing protein n=1 Tax=Aeromonas veronii TaxID=654 RepID=UPI00217F1B52|nr:prophage tail fiber N-terminal domain-containing protein [Aeromonas veronii]UWH29762.1 prophage tail fiber N-terminal domain-containing protein [Aeromonas veronii]
MIRIFGTMTDPSGSPVPGAIIELRAINSTSEVLLGSTVNHKCDQQGAYSFQLAAGMYDAYAQNDRCGDMDYLGTAKVSANSVDGDLHSILVDGGINITPPMLEGALAAAQRAESAATLTAADRVSTGKDAESAKADSATAKTAKDGAESAASTAVSAKDSIVADTKDVRSLAAQVATQATDVSVKHGDVAAKAAQVSAHADVVSTKHGEVVAKAAQVSDDASATQSAKNISVAAADTATQKAASAATHDASAQDAATRAENAASAVVGAVLDGGECDLSSGIYPQPITVAGKKYSTIWYVAVAGSVSGIAFDVGDILRYTTAKTGYYFKVDAKDDVYSVNGDKGAVVITPEKIGAEKTGVAQQLVEQHTSKPGAHGISSVQGLTEALAGKEATGTASSAVASHEGKESAHPISGIAGLRAELDTIKAAVGDAVLDVKWLTKRSPMRTGYAAGDGQTLSRSLYPDAFAAIQASLVPVCSDADWLADPAKRGCFTLGDGSTTFRVPDYNGMQPGSYGPVYLGGGNSVSGLILQDRIQNIQAGGIGSTARGFLASDTANISGAFNRTRLPNGIVPGDSSGSYERYSVGFDASLVARTGDTTRPITAEGCWAVKLFGAVQNAGSADAAALATAVAELAARVSVLEQRKHTTLIPVTFPSGAPHDKHETIVSQLPANVEANRRYVLPNPFGVNTRVSAVLELYVNGRWAEPKMDGLSGSGIAAYGAYATYVQGEGIVIQTGATAVLVVSNQTGGGHGYTGASLTSAPCRVFVCKLEA